MLTCFPNSSRYRSPLAVIDPTLFYGPLYFFHVCTHRLMGMNLMKNPKSTDEGRHSVVCAPVSSDFGSTCVIGWWRRQSEMVSRAPGQWNSSLFAKCGTGGHIRRKISARIVFQYRKTVRGTGPDVQREIFQRIRFRPRFIRRNANLSSSPLVPFPLVLFYSVLYRVRSRAGRRAH